MSPHDLMTPTLVGLLATDKLTHQERTDVLAELTRRNDATSLDPWRDYFGWPPVEATVAAHQAAHTASEQAYDAALTKSRERHWMLTGNRRRKRPRGRRAYDRLLPDEHTSPRGRRAGD